MPLFDERKENTQTLKAGHLVSASLGKLDKILGETGPRPAGSNASRQAARMLLSYFKEYSDDAVITAVTSSESAYRDTLKLIALSAVPVLVLCFVGQPHFALIVEALVIFLFIKEFILCHFEKNYHFGKCEMSNVHAVIEPEEEVEETYVFTAHHDSAPMFSKEGDNLLLSLYLPLLHYCLIVIVSFISVLAEIVSGKLFAFNLPSLFPLILLVLLALSSFIYLKLYKLIGKECSPGAGDNLVSSCLLTELAHYFWWKKQNGKGLKHARLIFASFDGEECGLKGSANWFEAYRELCINAKVLNIDAPYDEGHLTFLTKDANGFVKLSSSLASSFAAVAKKMGYQVFIGSLPLFAGSTDAASAARAGYEATSLIGFLPSERGLAHSVEDVPSALSEEALVAVLSIAIKIVETLCQEEGEEEAPSALEDKSQKLLLKR